MARKPKPRLDLNDPKNKMVIKLVEQIREEVKRRHGTNLTYEQRRDASAAVMAEVLWADEEKELQELVTDDDEVDIGGTRYRRLEQASSAVYYGRWGAHEVEESLYREVGVHNGPTVKQIERRGVGMIARRMTPDLARIVGELTADGNSREVGRTMRTVGLVPPSRSFLEKRVQQMAGEMAAKVEHLEAEARVVESLPAEVVSVSCGMDRMSVRMSEPHSIRKTPRRRGEPSRISGRRHRPRNTTTAWHGSGPRRRTTTKASLSTRGATRRRRPPIRARSRVG